jgi:pimeloyl-ACP methyl ester carboxylesterase
MGYGMRGVVWRTQIEKLSERCRVAYFDNRGIGASDPIAHDRWSIRDMAEDTARVLDALGWESAHIVGVSMGGMIAQELALAYPERCQSLSLIVTHAGGVLAWMPRLAGLATMLRTSLARTTEIRLRFRKELLYPAHFLAVVDRGEMARRIAEAGAPTADTARKQLRAIQGHRARQRLRHVRVPTLIVRAALDQVISPKHSDDLHRLIPGAQMARFEDAGHGVIFQRGPEVSERLLRHIVAAEARTNADATEVLTA